jgi:hypothetical protein
MVSDEFVRNNPNLPKRTYGSVGGWPLLPREELRHQGVLDVENLDTPIYRIFPTARLLQTVKSRNLVLVRPKLWEDPFENFLLQVRVEVDGGVISIADLHDRYFGQCWTMNEETDAMWRIYSPTSTGLKVRTTVRRLFDSLYGQNATKPELALFLGLVRYIPEQQFGSILGNRDIARTLLLDATGINQVRTLLLKRYEFSHEAEVRIVFREVKPRYNVGLDIRTFDIDPNKLFEEVVLDPRAKKLTATRLERSLRRAGYAGTIRQSDLYTFSASDVTIASPGPRPAGARTWYDVRADKLRTTDWR